jgi:ribosome-binding protein aMBF1 (putative translation factor)
MEVVFYRGAGRLQPVQAFLEELEPVERRAAAENQVDRLAWLRVEDPPLPPPWDEPVEAELRALRVWVGGDLLRVLYRRAANTFVLLHAYQALEPEISEEELRTARRNSTRSKVAGRPPAGGLDTPIGQPWDAHLSAAELDEPYRDARRRLHPLEQVARLLIRYRMDHGLSQTQLAQRAGISHSVVSRMETGQHHVNLDTLGRLATALGQRLLIAFQPYT